MGNPPSTLEADESGTLHLQAESRVDVGSSLAIFNEGCGGYLEARGSEEGRRESPNTEDRAIARSDVVQRATATPVLGRWAQFSGNENLECRDV